MLNYKKGREFSLAVDEDKKARAPGGPEVS